MAFVTRFAPSPTGPLHLGHAYSALLAHDMARAEGGKFLLRIEDIDRSRSKPGWESQILDDLAWLGIRWDAAPLRQSDRLNTYQKALDVLWALGLIYPCICSRRDIETALSAPQEGAGLLFGADGVTYPGSCRSRMADERRFPAQHPRPTNTTLRIELNRVADSVFNHRTASVDDVSVSHLSYHETGIGPQLTRGLVEISRDEFGAYVGDFVIAGRDTNTSYHLSVVLDDAEQGVTHVVRGADLTESTKIHVFLQRLLGLPTPIYHHHRLIRDDQGKRLAKRDDARALAKYRAEGATPADIRALVGL